MAIQEYIDGIPLGALPRLHYVLENSRDFPAAHENLDLRHPFSIYQVSLVEILDRINELLKLITPLYSNPLLIDSDQGATDTAIRHSTDAVLDALMEHFDDCSNLLKCYLDNGPAKKKNQVFSLVQTNWRDYRGHVATIVNRIKHKQRRVRTIVFYGDTWAAPGYFIEGPAGPKLIGPDPEIHKGGGTAFSFRRNLAFHICSIYSVSRSIATALGGVDPIFRNAEPAGSPTDFERSWVKMIVDIDSLTRFVYPDEAAKPYPLGRVTGSKLTIAYPSKERPIPVPNARITASSRVDGMSPSIRMPYFGTTEP